MRISQLAERTGVPASTLRFYDTAGLLPVDRTAAGYRSYGEEAVERLAFIRTAKRLGLPLEEIAGLLTVWASGSCADVRADLRPRVAARIAGAERRAAELAVFADSLRAAVAHLDGLPERSEPCDRQCGYAGDGLADHLGPGLPPRPAPAESCPPPGGGRRAERWRAAPVACSLTGGDLDDRVARWRLVLEDADRADLEEGVRLTVPADRTEAVAALAAAEQRCCPFMDFRLHLDGRRLHLEVRAPAEAAEMIADLFG